jgi:hypothetical protein
MPNTVPSFAAVTTILAAAVANNGTFTVPYPTGFSQGSFLNGLALSNSSMIVNSNDKYVQGTGFTVSYGASLITVTNTTGLTLPAGASILFNFNQVAGNDVEIVTLPVDLATITGTQDVVTTWQPGFAGTIEQVDFIVDKPVTTAAKLATISPFVNAVAVTGGALALTSALATPKGKDIAASAITALNAFGVADTLSFKATAVTAFVEGSGSIVFRIRRAYSNRY